MRAPRNWGEGYAAKFDAICPELAEEHGLLLYPFFLDGVAMDAALNLGDGLHPNPRGVDKIVAGILPQSGPPRGEPPPPPGEAAPTPPPPPPAAPPPPPPAPARPGEGGLARRRPRATPR